MTNGQESSSPRRWSIAEIANQEAQAEDCDRRQAYHIALALIGMMEDEVGHILASNHVTREAFLAAVRKVINDGARETRHDIGAKRRESCVKHGRIPPSLEAQAAQEAACFEIDPHGAITPSHVLVGLLSIRTGIAAIAFAEMGVADKLWSDAVRVVAPWPAMWAPVCNEASRFIRGGDSPSAEKKERNARTKE